MGQASKLEGGPGLALKEIEERRDFLEFSERDVLLLREIHAYLETTGVKNEFTQDFYTIISFPIRH